MCAMTHAFRFGAKATRAAAHARQGPTAGAALAAHGLGFAGASSRTDVSAFLAIGEEIDPMPLMRRLWAHSRGGAIDEADITTALQQLAGAELSDALRAWVHGSDDPPLPALLARAGVDWRHDQADLAAELGLRVSEAALSGIHVKHVLRGGAAERAGVCAGDELLAADGWRLRRLEDARGWVAAGAGFELTLVRDQRLLTLPLPPATAPGGDVQLQLAEAPAPAALALRREWLGV